MSTLKNKGVYTNYYPVSDWDKAYKTKQLSEYYAVMVQQFGQAMADYYWNRRYTFDTETYWSDLCKEINEKCDIFFKSKGIKIPSVWQQSSKKRL